VAYTYGRFRFAAKYDFRQEELVDMGSLSGENWKTRWKMIALLSHPDKQQPTNKRRKDIPQFDAKEFELAETTDDDGNVLFACAPYGIIQNAIDRWKSLSVEERTNEFLCEKSQQYREALKRHLEYTPPPPRPVFESLTATEIEAEARLMCDRMRRFYNNGKTPGVTRLTEHQIAEKEEKERLDGVPVEE
jgi:hypothetical protein